ncbi:MAG: ATP-dependent DNA helicase RecG [Thermodesulfovibrionales bacterium]|nr:ATP-dependent DNA helicase RecG [Thermodesulfovibrionales bacterium]
MRDSIQYIKGVGKERAKILEKLGIRTLKDAFYYLPRRYEDRRFLRPIARLRYGKIETVRAKIASVELIEKKGLKILELTLSDGTGVLKAKWFNQPYLKKIFKPGQELMVSAPVKRNAFWGIGFEMENPDYEFVEEDDETIHTARIVPVYGLTKGITQRQMRRIMFSVVNDHSSSIEDFLPQDIIKELDLPPLKESLLNIHFPSDSLDPDTLNEFKTPYQRRLAFDEIFLFQTGLFILKKNKSFSRGIAFKGTGILIERLKSSLPYRLTSAQERVLKEIIDDMKSPLQMNRLIQGDVGCGKTIIALMAALLAVEDGYQAALMAPTEILAEQHYINIHRLVEDLGLKIALISRGVEERPLDLIEKGEIDIVVGTHALLEENVRFRKLGLVIIDEQHRFGVIQRSKLRTKGDSPDVLVMTATPIPRTLALTLYGDLDYSIIDELPPGRSPVVTKVMYQSQKSELYKLIREEVNKGRQVYVVYPVIDESEELNLKSAIQGREAFQRIFPEFRIGLLHGRLKPSEKEEIMKAFKSHRIDILVSTTVIEVGIDVPNATLMVIVHAERFGLSQLHQLRGRVGRGSERSYCVLLVYEPLSEEARQRITAMERYSDGFSIAEQDLLIRGPGEFFGTRQSGMPDLKIANIVRDGELIPLAREAASELVKRDGELKRYPLLREYVEEFWQGKIELFVTG